MECLGGNGYVEESTLPRLYREAPVNAIWEGSGNVMCLDVLRAHTHERETTTAVVDALASEAADLPGARVAADFVRAALIDEGSEPRARAAVDVFARLAAAAALRGSAPPEVAELFARTRLADGRRTMYGTSDIMTSEARHLLERALPLA